MRDARSRAEGLIDSITITGQRLRYAVFGPADAARTLLVFNGIGAPLETVAPFAATLRDTRIVTFDMPGIGGSPAPALPYRLAWPARLAARLLDALGIGAADVFGFSWGGALAQQFARDFPARTRSLTLAASSAGAVMVPGDPLATMALVTPRAILDPDWLVTRGPAIFGGRLRRDPAPLRAHALAMRSEAQLGYVLQLAAIAGWTSWFWLPRIAVPALILMGADDPIVPVANGALLARRLPDARLHVIECGHLFILTDMAGTAALVEDFIATAAPPAA